MAESEAPAQAETVPETDIDVETPPGGDGAPAEADGAIALADMKANEAPMVNAADLEEKLRFMRLTPGGMGMADYVVLQANGVNLRLLRYDMASGGLVTFESTIECMGQLPRTVVKTDMLTGLVGKLPDKTFVRLRRIDGEEVFEISYDGARYRMCAQNVSGFRVARYMQSLPDYPSFDGLEQIGFYDKRTMHSDSALVQKNTADDALRPAMKNATVRELDGQTHLIGTDGHRLVCTPIEGRVPAGLMLPRWTLHAQRLFHNSNVRIGAVPGADDDRRRILFKCGDEAFSFLEPDEKYPNWQAVIPTGPFNGTLQLNRPEETVGILERLEQVRSDQSVNKHVRLELSGESVVATNEADHYDSGGTETIDSASYGGPDAAVGVNSEYLSSLVAFLDPPVRIRLQVKDGTTKRAMILRDAAGRMCLLMPVMLSKYS